VSPAAHAPALYGKIPAQGDFLRSNVVDPAAVEFSHWLEEAQETMYRTGAALPQLPVCFLHVIPQARTAVLGALLPSRDAVGRVFPLAAFIPVDTAALARSYPRAPLAYSMFLGEVARLGREASALSAAVVLERVRALPLPAPGDWALADDLSERLLERPAKGLLDPLRVDDVGPAYGIKTLLAACRNDAQQMPAKARVVLECPLTGEGPAPWLELSSRVLAWRQPPAFFWTEAAPPRLLLALGGPPAAVLNHLARPDPRSTLVWPLRTQQRAAAETALQTLSPAQRAALEDETLSIAQLFSALVAEERP
jgi:type VI secretion system ImpM family protein